ncbi:MAG: FtsX-like permease family protein, partial [Polaribacter sp.]
MPNIVIQFRKQPEGNWGRFSNSLFIKTTKNANVKSLEKKAVVVWYQKQVLPSAEAEGVTPKVFIEKHGRITPFFEPLKDIRLKTIASDAGPEGKGNYQLILIMLSLSVLLILISCVNFINLSIASATQRAKEVGVKKTLGLSKGLLIRQYALEIVLQGFVAFVLSLLVVEFMLPYFNDFMDKDISILESNLLLKVGVLAIIISFVIGSIPAIYISKFKAVEVLKGNVSRSKKGVFARNIMLGVQFLISGFFLTGSIIINKQVQYMMHKDLGFKGDQVITISMNTYKDRYRKYLLAKKELIKHPNIKAVTSNLFTIGGGASVSTNFDYKGISIQTNVNAMDYNYLDVMGIKILKGRGLKEEIASDTIKNILINETLAKALHIYDNPIGKKLNAGFGYKDNDGKNLQVIGMVKDYNVTGLNTKIQPIVFMHWNNFDVTKNNFWSIQFKIKPNNVQETFDFIEKYWEKNIEQGYPFQPQFVNKRFAKTYKKYQKQQTLFFILTCVVIIISLLGLFALATLTIQQRLKEVAIRKTLGASTKEIIFQLIKNFLKI